MAGSANDSAQLKYRRDGHRRQLEVVVNKELVQILLGKSSGGRDRRVTFVVPVLLKSITLLN